MDVAGVSLCAGRLIVARMPCPLGDEDRNSFTALGPLWAGGENVKSNGQTPHPVLFVAVAEDAFRAQDIGQLLA